MATPSANATASAPSPAPDTSSKKTMTDAALAANRSNAQKSTGPKTASGRAKSATNSVSHGLTATSELFLNPEDQLNYETLKARLRAECLPGSQLEEQAFLRFAFSTFQAQRAQAFEVQTQDRWLDNPENPNFFNQMERFVKLTALLERRADKALNELRRLQADRITSMRVHGELYCLGKKVDIPASFPTTELLKSNLSQTSPGILAVYALSFLQEVKDIIENQTPPKDDK